ncbi:unnamed protein product [Microthlaspi erraticum]|uniref:Uncharacterized protein n=1 Tax=Microthlaspi erraticum TaxID=1685480 RepID=A0A6D2J2E6_9BRAS|nr:unnamed protein product [Microthlaspi erraticum]
MTGLSSGDVRFNSETSLILSAGATEDPTNFITHVNLFASTSVSFNASVFFSFKTARTVLLRHEPESLLVQEPSPMDNKNFLGLLSAAKSTRFGEIGSVGEFRWRVCGNLVKRCIANC